MRLMPFFIFALAACTEFPALDGSISDTARDAPYPTVSSLPDITSNNVPNDVQMATRVAALQARAERLRRINIAALQ
ncbi:hypothetical protein CLV80_102415 [Yoonia maritima]|uniref:Uncharacterized protein n=1 Tax=Yoonia maritima TaxID=1435347 RepID=A0A2T0W434_9RHOB|nr:hypothetical protein [Yoonia maritima]PRY79767.1 hypothetical protein CLV80_102415 [Yoonia maritima]